MNDMAKNLLLWVVIAVVLIMVFQSFNPRGSNPSAVSYSEFMQQVNNNTVQSVNISGKRKDGSALLTTAPELDQQLVPALLAHNVVVNQEPADNSSTLWRYVFD